MSRSTLLIAAAAGAASLLATPAAAVASTFSLNKTYDASNFLSEFSWSTPPSGVGGYLEYVSQGAAMQKNVTEVRDGSLFLRVQSNNSPRDPTNYAARIVSKQAWGDGAYVVNVSHVPSACWSRPTLQTIANKPDDQVQDGTLINIIQNGNEASPGNVVTLRASNCLIPTQIPSQLSSSTVINGNCTWLGQGYFTNGDGCEVGMGTDPPTWGQGLNANGGGIYAMVRDMSPNGSGISVWYFKQGSEPADLKLGSNSMEPIKWGTPAVHMDVASTCKTELGSHNIVFDMSIGIDVNVGYKDGISPGNSSCFVGTQNLSALEYYVATARFPEAYWQVNNIRVFTPSKYSNSTASGSGNGGNSGNSAGNGGEKTGTASLSFRFQPVLLTTLALLGAAAALI
ncbi:hypothetical protein OC842_003267 [Tilletia horrida]|uniref:GH16 domain-containing protein n=1 Tax=Tilletia horrida TaxID=155126 RepID=A0AAN6GD46_9BASI|nr:hypothetical protein OC842_003267 [Tilletia horrida]